LQRSRHLHRKIYSMIRVLDFIFSFFGLLILSPVLIVLVVVGLFDTGSPLFLQKRVGRHRRTFTLIKFRTMSKSTPSQASHLVSSAQITKYGSFLRRTKLDELPQLLNVVTGAMSLVGPRPCLPNQDELILLRKESGVFHFRPGITGLAQINNIDMSEPEILVKKEVEMVNDFTVTAYFKYIFATVGGKGSGDAIKSI